MELLGDWSTATVHANGVDLQTYRTGDGPPLLMAHGYYDNGRCWSKLVPDLAADHEVVSYDARAHGLSGAPQSGYALEDRVADLVGLVEALDLADPILFGHSMGGSTVAATAALHPDLPRAVVLEDPAGMLGEPDVGPDERAESVRERVATWDERGIDDLAAEFAADHDPELARRLAEARTELRPEIAEIARAGYPYVPDLFGDIGCPALVLRSDRDPAERANDFEEAETLRDGRLVHVPGAGHCVFRDRYDAAYAELRAFLRRV